MLDPACGTSLVPNLATSPHAVSSLSGFQIHLHLFIE